MNFEFDPNKNIANKTKHGIDFTGAQKLWDDPDRVEIPAKTVDEVRYMLIAKYRKKHWSAIFTIRADNIRIISVRRSRREEIEIYES